jgi:hypothetical protein
MYAQNWKAITALALAFVLGTGTSSMADNLSVRYGQSSCSYAEDTDNGKSLELYGDFNDDQEVQVGFKYVINFQKPKSRNAGCYDMQRLATQRMQLDLETQRLELEMLRTEIAQAKAELLAPKNETFSDNEEW